MAEETTERVIANGMQTTTTTTYKQGLQVRLNEWSVRSAHCSTQTFLTNVLSPLKKKKFREKTKNPCKGEKFEIDYFENIEGALTRSRWRIF